MDPSTAQTVQDLIAQGKSREDITSALVAKGMSVKSAIDLLDVMAPNSAATSTVAPGPQPIPTPIPAAPAPANSLPIAAAPSPQAQPKRLPKWLMVLGALILIILIAGGAFIFFSAQSAKFKTVSYNNGEGNQFKLSFYSHYTTQKVFTPTSSQSSGGSQDANFAGLYAKNGLYGKAPLVVVISSTALTSISPAAYTTYSKCTSAVMSVAATVHNSYLGTDLNVCAIHANGTALLEVAVFKDVSKFYIVTITQKPSTTQPSAAATAELGLAPYQSDIQTIVASIRLISK